MAELVIRLRVLAAAERFGGERPSEERMQDLLEQRLMMPLFV
jgi:hypothetical protein